jgi:hypothetical protein
MPPASFRFKTNTVKIVHYFKSRFTVIYKTASITYLSYSSTQIKLPYHIYKYRTSKRIVRCKDLALKQRNGMQLERGSSS